MKITRHHIVNTVSGFLSVVILVLAGCLGGGGGGGLGSLASVGGGIGGTGVSFGSVSGFASIILNGIDFSTSGTIFTVNGAPAVEGDLEIGQVVRAEVDFGASSAARVDYAETVRGPIQAIDVVNRTMTVLNQQIIVSDTTSFFNNILFENLVVGNEVEISGLRTNAGEIAASYVRLRNGTAEYRVIGEVANLTPTTFEIVGPAPRLIINYSAANQALSSALVDGLLIEAIGLSGNFNAVLNTFTISDLEDGLELNAAVGDDVEVEGIITTFNSLASFIVNGQLVNGSGATIEFEDGTPATAADLGVNVKVEVEGEIAGSGVLQADRIIIKPDTFVRLTATVDAVDVSAQTLTILGIVINVTPTTRMEDDSAIGLPQFGLGDIMPGNYVEMRGAIIGTDVVASRIEREDFDTEVEYQGPVDAFDTVLQTVTILGNTLIVDVATLYFDENDVQILVPANFFNALSVGSIVKAQWDPFGALTDPVDEFEIE